MNVKKKKVLILNKGWSPIRVVNLEKAITILFSEYKNGEPKAKIISEDYQALTWDEWSKIIPSDTEETIHSAHAQFKIPEIIQLTRYNKIPFQKMSFSRNNLYKRDEGKCMYCGVKLELKNCTVDHLTPKSKNGPSSWLNCVLSCRSCNFKKADQYLEKTNLKLLKTPFIPSYSLVSLDIKEANIKSWKNFI